MTLSRVVEYVFFFALLGLAGYMVWLITAPFIGALALSLIIVTICQPLHTFVKKHTFRNSKTLAAFISTILVLIVIILPLVILSSIVLREVIAFYQGFNGSQEVQVLDTINLVQTQIQSYFPGFEINIRDQIKSTGDWLMGNIGSIFAGTVSTVFVFLISIIGSFYFFRDGKEFMQLLIKISPLPDSEDEVILNRMAGAVRAVATGTLLVALIQGTLAALGFAIFGIPHPVLWGTMGTVGALMPGLGTSLVTAPAIIYLFISGHTIGAVGLLIWSILIVGLVDNLLGPYLIGRKSNMHPFIILISVLGGIVVFGPLGFIVGPVIVTLFLVLLEIYDQYILKEKHIDEAEII
jgi:predicted PurR-regulated permease PerM